MKKIYQLFFILVCLLPVRSFAQCTATTVPYYESFEGVTASNPLPACWSVSNPSTCLTTNSAFSGNKGASFYYSPAGNNYFYSNGIQLYAGVIYSASIWYNTGINGGTDWSNLSILVGTSQSTTGLVVVASTAGPAVSNVFTALSNTFTVPVSGVYYMVVKGTNNGAGLTQFLNWDDLAVSIPCTGAGAPNSPTVSVAPASPTICSGQSLTYTVSGADIYNVGGPVVVTPTLGSNVSSSIIGTNTLTGCMSSVSLNITVNPSPLSTILANDPEICSGNSTILMQPGSANLTHSLNGSPVTFPLTLSPTVTTTYSIVTGNSYNCTSTSSLQIIVHPLPVITVSNAKTDTACAGEKVILNAGGAVSYQWATTAGMFVGNSVTVTPNASTSYSVTGTDAQGCSATTNYLLKVNACAGLNQATHLAQYAVYPNPFSGQFTVEINNGAAKTITVMDITGRAVFSTESLQDKTTINMREFAHGIYYVKVQSGDAVEFFEIIKQ